MRAVAQRVLWARVKVDGVTVGAIERGLLVYLGVGAGDLPLAVSYITDKISGLRVFEDPSGRMQHSVTDVRGAVLVVPQFTLYGDLRKGRRPDFTQAMEPVGAEALYLSVVASLKAKNIPVETGLFRATMLVESANEGPVNILLDSARNF